MKLNKKVVCVWIGTFPVEKEFYQDYFELKYDEEDEDKVESKFGNDVGLDWYDHDFRESWWFEKLEWSKILSYKEGLLQQEYFFDEVVEALKKQDLKKYNTLTFLYGEKGKSSFNERLFEYVEPLDIGNRKSKPIKFLLKKEY